LLGGAADAAASGSCTYDTATKVVTATLTDELEGRILRSGKKIVLFTSLDTTTHPCGGATVTNTKRIDVTGTGWSMDVAYVNIVTVDESAGRLAPGTRAETTRSNEIEVRISVTPGDNVIPPYGKLPLQLAYIGTGRADRETAGANGLDLNSDGDVDVTATLYPFDWFAFYGLDGPDRLSGAGSTATGAALQVPIDLRGGYGDDYLRGGAANDSLQESAGYGGDGHDLLIGGAGDDLLSGGARNDRLRGGTGNDELYGMAGHDLLYAKDGWADAVGGGSGVDDATVDEGLDVVTGVENFF
jgi:Ca2+-binding RTX toxin-like protein